VTPGLPCCFEGLLKVAVEEEARHSSQGYATDPFGGSPLSSAPSSATPSPLNSPLLLPVESENGVFEFSPDLLGRSSNTAAAEQGRGSGRRAYKRRQSHARRKKKREAVKVMDPTIIRPAIIEKHVASAEPVNIAFDLVDGSAASGAYVGVRSKPSKALHGLDDLVGEESKWKSKYVAWDGR